MWVRGTRPHLVQWYTVSRTGLSRVCSVNTMARMKKVVPRPCSGKDGRGAQLLQEGKHIT